jgi:hypothetical protein
VPGNNSSTGKHFSGRCSNGDEWLLDALGQAAWPAARYEPGSRYFSTTCIRSSADFMGAASPGCR